MADIVDRLRAYADCNEASGLYTEAKCALDAIKEIETLRSKLNELSWKANPDRSGGAFTNEELADKNTWR